MKAGLTHIALVIDKSGSVKHIKEPLIAAVNKFLDDQSKVAGELTAQVFRFNTRLEATDPAPIASIQRLTPGNFKVSGWSRLYDSIAEAVELTGRRLAALPEDQRPSKVIVAIFTDGMDNRSENYSAAVLANAIDHQSSVYNWSFVFLGGNMNAGREAEKIGIPRSNAFRFTADDGGVDAAFRRLNNHTTCFREGRLTSINGCDVPSDAYAGSPIPVIEPAATTAAKS